MSLYQIIDSCRLIQYCNTHDMLSHVWHECAHLFVSGVLSTHLHSPPVMYASPIHMSPWNFVTKSLFHKKHSIIKHLDFSSLSYIRLNYIWLDTFGYIHPPVPGHHDSSVTYATSRWLSERWRSQLKTHLFLSAVDNHQIRPSSETVISAVWPVFYLRGNVIEIRREMNPSLMDIGTCANNTSTLQRVYKCLQRLHIVTKHTSIIRDDMSTRKSNISSHWHAYRVLLSYSPTLTTSLVSSSASSVKL